MDKHTPYAGFWREDVWPRRQGNGIAATAKAVVGPCIESHGAHRWPTPEGGARDTQGRPITDPQAGMHGGMLRKGAVPALVVALRVAHRLQDEGVRRPGAQRQAPRQRARAKALVMADALVARGRGPQPSNPPGAA